MVDALISEELLKSHKCLLEFFRDMCLSHGGKQHLEQPSDSTLESATLHNLLFLTPNRNQSLHSQAADCWGCNLLISVVTPINLNIHSPTISIQICQDA